MDSELRGILTALLEGQQFLIARMEAHAAESNTRVEALSLDTSARFEALSGRMDAHAADTNVRLDLLTADMAAVKAQLGDVHNRLRYLAHKTAELEQDLFVVKEKQGA